jgi:hypothetical protein
MILLRVPYPLGFYAKGLDRRIDDSTTRTPAGRGVDDQRRPDAVALWRAARARSPSSYTSSCAPIRSRADRSNKS